MRLKDIEADLPILLFNYDRVVRRLSRPRIKAKRKVPRKAALDMFLETRSFSKTAAHFHCSPATINGIVWQAFRIARQLAELDPLDGVS